MYSIFYGSWWGRGRWYVKQRGTMLRHCPWIVTIACIRKPTQQKQTFVTWDNSARVRQCSHISQHPFSGHDRLNWVATKFQSLTDIALLRTVNFIKKKKGVNNRGHYISGKSTHTIVSIYYLADFFLYLFRGLFTLVHAVWISNKGFLTEEGGGGGMSLNGHLRQLFVKLRTVKWSWTRVRKVIRGQTHSENWFLNVV